MHCLVELPRDTPLFLQLWNTQGKYATAADMSDEAVGFCLCEVLIFLITFSYSLRACRNVCKITTDRNISRNLWSICLNFKCCICICTAVSDIKPWCIFWIPTNYAISFLSCCFSFHTTTISKFLHYIPGVILISSAKFRLVTSYLIIKKSILYYSLTEE